MIPQKILESNGKLMLNLSPMNANVIIFQMIKDFINGLVLMKHLVKDLLIIMKNILPLILLILLKDVSYSMNINLKKYKLIMVLNLLGIKKK